MLRLFEHLILLPACILARLTDDFICLFLGVFNQLASFLTCTRTRRIQHLVFLYFYFILAGCVFLFLRLRFFLHLFCLIILFLNGCTPFIDHFVDRLKEENTDNCIPD